MADLHLLPQATRLLSGTLSAFLAAAATSMTVSNPPSTSRLPTYIEIEPDSSNKETVRVTNVVGNVCTIERGVYTGGVGTDHQSNSTYKEKITQKHWDGAIVALEDGWLTEDSIYALAKVDNDTFSIAGIDRTGYATAGRILRLNSTTIVTVLSSSYGGGNTTVNTNETTVPTPITKLEYALAPKGATDKYATPTDITNVKSDVQKTAYSYAADAGASDAYAITLSPVPAAYTTGMMIVFKANTLNTGPCTLNVNSLGAKSLKIYKDQDPPNNYIKAGSFVLVVYDGTNFQILSVWNIPAPKVVTLTDGVNIATDASLGNYFTVTLAGNRTMDAPTNPTDGQIITYEIKQDATGGRTLAWAAGGFSFGAGSAPTLSTAASKVDLQSFRYSATVGKWLDLGNKLGF